MQEAKKESSCLNTTQIVPKAGTQGLKAVTSIKKPLDFLDSDLGLGDIENFLP